MTTEQTLGKIFAGNERPGSDILTVRDLRVRFGGLTALAGINLDVAAQDTHAIIGPNGAGKTTTLNAICRLIRSTGQVALHGRRIGTASPSSLAAQGIGRSFQDPHLVDDYTIIENVLCGAHSRIGYLPFDQVFRRRKVRAAEAEMAERAMFLLDFAGISRFANRTAGSLPYGARKLVDIVRSMICGPAIVLLDEPSSGLDQGEREALAEILSSVRAIPGVGVLVVEHHMDLVRAVATRVTALQAGEVLMTGTADEVLDSQTLVNALVGHVEADSKGLPS